MRVTNETSKKERSGAKKPVDGIEYNKMVHFRINLNLWWGVKAVAASRQQSMQEFVTAALEDAVGR